MAQEHPFGVLLLLTFTAMPVVWGVEWLEKVPETARWAARHRGTLAIFKQTLCMISIPGLLSLWFWTPGVTKPSLTESQPRWVLSVILGCVFAFLLYYALRLHLAAK